MRVKIHVSGDGLVVKDNILKDRQNDFAPLAPSNWKPLS